TPDGEPAGRLRALLSEALRPLHRAQSGGCSTGGGCMAVSWSSCRAYALGQRDALLAINPWYEQWSPEPERRQLLWQEFVRGPIPRRKSSRQTIGRSASSSFAVGCSGRRRGRSPAAAAGQFASWKERTVLFPRNTLGYQRFGELSHRSPF